MPATGVDTASSPRRGPLGGRHSARVRDGRGTPQNRWRLGIPRATSTTITFLPRVARKMPRLAARRLLPMPPLPPPTATTWGSRVAIAGGT